MLKIIFAPEQFFHRLAEKPVWTLPLILALIVPLLIGTLASALLPRASLIESIQSRIDRTREFIDQQVEKGKMPSDQREAAIQRIDETARAETEFYQHSSFISLLFRFLIRSLPAVAWSALLLIVWSTILNLLLPLLGASSSFARTFAITTNAALIRILSGLFHAVLILATSNLAASTSLAPLARNLTIPLYLKGVLAGIDIFTIWELVLVSIGLKVVFNLKLRNAALAVFSVWFVYLLLLAGLVTLSGGLALV